MQVLNSWVDEFTVFKHLLFCKCERRVWFTFFPQESVLTFSLPELIYTSDQSFLLNSYFHLQLNILLFSNLFIHLLNTYLWAPKLDP